MQNTHYIAVVDQAQIIAPLQEAADWASSVLFGIGAFMCVAALVAIVIRKI